ncbi:DNA topoisomerase (ATP-hydrolyzing) subunit A [Rhodopirellula sp. MGV]|uniref:DNA gyrase/topoisomerase IV subunit A n=1 Tax=Rhodopirellula sp. MGV TaxID=2023130 RepID=UPI000B968122|nr:DNA topoisomerase (ATP-hydrolyzing) [Rhodopirellula sp. MGV]OYP31687.1 DNA topoisomerase [Rhodopirellula sp. MGV]PNY33988.1 DNA topoisomerase 4 subunit A [Rhodopirellula baltica]
MAKRRTRNQTGKNGKSLFESVDESILQAIPLRQAAQERYLNYSLSVITSRALPDVRDGLKPVQRRTLYTMHQQGLNSTAKHRKCAKVVGDVMGNYHPHGDSSIYEALVRMAQPFSMRMPLIDGSGNFGSVDGDNAAAMRYTECRMTPIAGEVLADLSTRTVPFKANYDGTREEPVVLPSRLPNLLLNGTTGIAVGMATNIPPHNLKEIVAALLKLLRDPEIKDYQLVANDAIQAPDFPTGGQIINTKEELREIYQNGQGTIKLRGTAKEGEASTKAQKILQIDSIPYSVNKALLVERMSELVFDGKLPLVTEVRDLSTDEIRIDVYLKKDADESKVLAFLYKHTDLQKNFNVNMTCLIPTENPELGTPERLSLKEMLWYFLKFRLEIVTRRLENELAALERRLHILEGFALIFDALDEIIKIIRNSDGKADAAAKIMKRFPADQGGLDEDQTDAILELKLYRLARLEINLIMDELKDKNKRARQIRKLLKEDTQDTNSSGRWAIVREEIESLVTTYVGDKWSRRLTAIDSNESELEYSEEDFIVAEDCHVLVTRDGWVKRQKQINDPSKSRLRQGDEVLAVVAGDTRSTLGFFSSLGVCYTTRFIDVPASTGFGEPIQKLFKMKDGERIIAVMSFDSRTLAGSIQEDPKHPDYYPEVHAIAATTNGYAMRFGLAAFAEPSTRSGRRYARVATDASVIDVLAIGGSEVLLAVSTNCRAIVCESVEVNYLSGAGKGVMLIRLGKDDQLLGFKASSGDRDLLTVETNRGAKKTISTAKYRVTSRGGRGVEIQKNGKIAKIIAPPPAAPEPFEES